MMHGQENIKLSSILFCSDRGSCLLASTCAGISVFTDETYQNL